MSADIPTFVVMAVKERHELTANLLRQLGDADQIFIYDNGSAVAFPGAKVRAEATIHEMWNEGLDAAAAAADGGPHDVAVLNNDLDVEEGFLTKLAAGLRQDDRTWLAYPDWDGLGVAPGEARPVSRQDDCHLSGFAFMLRGEAGLRFDEQFEWWYGDTDMQWQVEASGRQLVCVGGIRMVHLQPGWSTGASPVLQARAEADRIRFEQKWDNRS